MAPRMDVRYIVEILLTEMNDPGKNNSVATETSWVNSRPSLRPSCKIFFAVALSSNAERLKAYEYLVSERCNI